MSAATRMLLHVGRTAKGSFIGYSPTGIPLYSFSSDALHRGSHSLMLVLKNGLRQILEESDSRKIFYFLCINLVRAPSLSLSVVCITCIITAHFLLSLSFSLHLPPQLPFHSPLY